MNQTYLDTARLPSQVASLIFVDGYICAQGCAVLRRTVTAYDGRFDCQSANKHVPRLKRLTCVLGVYSILYEVK